MDTSPEYIGMCKEAWEYLEFPLVIPRAYFTDVEDHVFIDRSGQYWYVPSPHHKYAFPLYRQDQLQELIEYDTETLIEEFTLWIFGGSCDVSFYGNIQTKFRTLEQLWLAFVMAERFQKTWDSDKKEWVKND